MIMKQNGELNLSQHLSDHFTLGQMIFSQYATRHGIPNVPDEHAIWDLMHLCENSLEKVRGIYQRPVHVDSGFRCLRLNTALKGDPHSQHLIGQAADFTIPGIACGKIISDIVRINTIPYDQLIWEGMTADLASGWIHISWTVSCRSEALTAVFIDGEPHYAPFA